MKTILVPIDFSPVSRRVIDVAAEFARILRGRVVLLHVLQVPPIVSTYEMDLVNLGELTVAMEKSADQQLAQFKTAMDQKSVETHVLRLTGFPSTEIVAQAKKLSADYIAIGSHGHTAFYDLILGSTTSAVMKLSSCPVIVVPALKRKLKKTAPPKLRSLVRQPAGVRGLV